MKKWPDCLAKLAARRQHGQMAFVVMLAFVPLFMIVAFGVDMGYWNVDHRRAQNQAEAAAHAAVDTLPVADAVAPRQTAVANIDKALVRNGVPTAQVANQRTCPTDPTDTTNMPPRPTQEANNFNPVGDLYSVRVCVRRESPATFAKLANIDSVWVSASARAQVQMVPLAYSLMAMNETSCASLDLTGGGGTGGINIDKGGTYTRSTGASCGSNWPLGASNNTHLTVTGGGTNDVHAGAGNCDGNGTTITPPCIGQKYLPDPYATVAQPTGNPPGSPPCKNGNDPNPSGNWANGFQAPPGHYCKGASIGPGNTATLDCSATAVTDCVFVFHGQPNGLIVNGTLNLVNKPGEKGVLLFFTCDYNPCSDPFNPVNKREAAGMNIAAGANVNLTGNPAYKDMLFWFDRTATNGGTGFSLAGGGTLVLNGRLYAMTTGVHLSGQTGTTIGLNMNIVADTIDNTGGANINITWDPQYAPVLRQVSITE